MAGRLPVLSGREVCAALCRAGFSEVSGRGKGSHIFVYRSDPATAITIPDQKEVRRGTLRAIIRQAGLSVEEFLLLL